MLFKYLPSTVGASIFLLSFNVNAFTYSGFDSGDGYERSMLLYDYVRGDPQTYLLTGSSYAMPDFPEYVKPTTPVTTYLDYVGHYWDSYIHSKQPTREFVLNFAAAGDYSHHITSTIYDDITGDPIYSGVGFSTVGAHSESEYIYRMGFDDILEPGTVVSFTVDYDLTNGFYCEKLAQCTGWSISEVAANSFDPVSDTATLLNSASLNDTYLPVSSFNNENSAVEIINEGSSSFTFDFTYGLGEELWIKLFSESDFSVSSLCNHHTTTRYDGTIDSSDNGCDALSTNSGYAWSFADPLITATVDGTEINVSKQLAGTPLFASESITVSAVPVPAAVWLFGSGLLGLIGLARRKKS